MDYCSARLSVRLLSANVRLSAKEGRKDQRQMLQLVMMLHVCQLFDQADWWATGLLRNFLVARSVRHIHGRE